MEIPEEFYREDQKAKADYVDKTEEGLRPQGIEGKQGGRFYGKVTLTRKGQAADVVDEGPK
jgi:hypothetical protein